MTARRSSGLEAMLSSTRCISSLARMRSVSSSVCTAPERLFDQPLQLAARRQLARRRARSPGAGRARRAISSGSGPASALIDDAGDLGRRDDVLGRGLDPDRARRARRRGRRVERGASGRVDDPWRVSEDVDVPDQRTRYVPIWVKRRQG